MPPNDAGSNHRDQAKAVREYVDIFRELRTRAGYEVLFGTLVGELRGVRIMEHTGGNDLQRHPTAWRTLTKFVLDDPD